MNIYGAFLLFGPELPPCVVAITDTQKARLDAQLAVASKHGKASLRHDAYRLVFGVPAHWAVPCWKREAMEAIATEYVGEFQDKVRGLAACIALGKPYGGPESGETQGKGKRDDRGQRARLEPVKPRKPSGGNKVQPSNAQELMFGKRAGAGEREALRIESLQA